MKLSEHIKHCSVKLLLSLLQIQCRIGTHELSDVLDQQTQRGRHLACAHHQSARDILLGHAVPNSASGGVRWSYPGAGHVGVGFSLSKGNTFSLRNTRISTVIQELTLFPPFLGIILFN